MIVFALTKLLTFLPFGNLLKGKGIIIIAIVGALALGGFLLWRYKASIEENISNQINAEFMEDVVRRQEEEFRKMQEIAAERDRLQAELAVERESLVRVLATLQAQLESGTLEDGAVAPILIYTIGALNKAEIERTE